MRRSGCYRADPMSISSDSRPLTRQTRWLQFAVRGEVGYLLSADPSRRSSAPQLILYLIASRSPTTRRAKQRRWETEIIKYNVAENGTTPLRKRCNRSDTINRRRHEKRERNSQQCLGNNASADRQLNQLVKNNFFRPAEKEHIRTRCVTKVIVVSIMSSLITRCLLLMW